MNSNRWLLLAFFGVGMISFAAGVPLGRTFLPQINDAPILYTNLRAPAKELNTALGILISSKPEDLNQVDVATMYFASLAGLPGAEPMDLDRAHAHFQDLAKLVQQQTEVTSKYQHSINRNFKDTPQAKAFTLVETAVCLICGGLWMDIIGLLGILKWNRTGHDQSSIPLIPVLLYAGAGYLLPTPIMGIHKGLYVLILVAFHLAILFVVPWLDRWLLKVLKK